MLRWSHQTGLHVAAFVKIQGYRMDIGIYSVKGFQGHEVARMTWGDQQ